MAKKQTEETKKAKSPRVTSTVEDEIKTLLLEYADEETDGNESFAIRKILRSFLTTWKKSKKAEV